MDILLYGALLMSQLGTTGKQFAMKKCGRIAPGPFNSVCINMARSLICLIVSIFIWLITGGGTTTFVGHLIIIISGIGTAFNFDLAIENLIEIDILKKIKKLSKNTFRFITKNDINKTPKYDQIYNSVFKWLTFIYFSDIILLKGMILCI